MKTAYAIMIIGCAVMLTAGLAVGASADDVAGPLGPGIEQGAQFSVGDNGESIVSFPACEDPRTGAPKRREPNGFMGYAIGSTDAAFTGNYVDAGITGVGFTVATEGPLNAAIRVMLVSGDRKWTKLVEGVSDEDGLPQAVEVSFANAEGWEAYVPDGDLAGAFAADLTNVDAIGLIISVRRSPAQTFTITDFVLKSGGGDIEVPLSPLALRLQRFGANVTTIAQAQAVAGSGADGDGDGLTALQEALIGTSDDDASSSLVAVVVERTATTATVSWKIGDAADDVTYKVRKADALASGFTTVATEIGVDQANASGQILWVDTEIATDAIAFYQVIAVVPTEL